MPCGEPPGGLAFLKKGAGAGGPCTGMALRGPGGQEPLSLAKKGVPDTFRKERGSPRTQGRNHIRPETKAL